jgi:hypothetical protein
LVQFIDGSKLRILWFKQKWTEECSLLGCCTVQSGRNLLMFQRNMQRMCERQHIPV